MKLADAVAASAAVPGAFTPINIESYADRCEWKPMQQNAKVGEIYGLKETKSALDTYRNPKVLKYIKLLDGGLTDNFGVQGLAQVRLLESKAYAPMYPERAIRLKRALFMVVNSGRGPTHGQWGLQLASPGMIELAGMVTDTAIDSSVHSTYDLFRLVMLDWRESLVKWRCSLPKEEVQKALGKDYGPWKCDDVHFYVTQLSFSDAGPEKLRELGAIPTRFALPKQQIDLLVDSASVALKANATYQEFIDGLDP